MLDRLGTTPETPKSPAANPGVGPLHRAVAVAAGIAFGVLLTAASVRAEIMWGDDYPALVLDGVLGWVTGWLFVFSPFLLGGLAWRYSKVLPWWTWAVLTLAFVVATLSMPSEIDCGDSINGYTCAGMTGGN